VISSSHILHDKMSIQPLPREVIAQIKSSTTITSLDGVVCELLKNSLDASSTKVDITIDYSRGSCVVEDDGIGILPAEFGEDGALGKLYREKPLLNAGLVLTRDRFLEINHPDSTSWWSRSIYCLPVCYVVAHDDISPPSTSFSQHTHHA